MRKVYVRCLDPYRAAPAVWLTTPQASNLKEIDRAVLARRVLEHVV